MIINWPTEDYEKLILQLQVERVQLIKYTEDLEKENQAFKTRLLKALDLKGRVN